MAAYDIQTTRLHIIDIALKYGYETLEAFSKAFTRFYGFPPSFIRRTNTQLRVFQPIQIHLEITGGWEDELPSLTKQTTVEQEIQNTCNFHISTNNMKQKKDWSILLQLVKKLQQTDLKFKIDGKTMIFAQGLEFKLDKICLTFKWKQEQSVLDFFNEDGEFVESYPGFKYYDTEFEGIRVRCMLYEEFQETDTDEIFYKNTDIVEIDANVVHVQSLEFYYENAKPDEKYYPMVEEYLKASLTKS